MFNCYSKIASKTKYRSIRGEGLKILTPKQMLQWLQIAITQVKASSTSENLLNEVHQIIYSLYWGNCIKIYITKKIKMYITKKWIQ